MFLFDLIKISKPIIQAPMAGVSTPALAAAVSNAGGLGSLGVGAMTSEVARKTIQETKALTKAPFNINVFCHKPATPNEAVEHAWLNALAPHFENVGAKTPERISEIYKSFVVDQDMLKVFVEERPAVVSFHFGLPPKEFIKALKDVGIVLFASATNLQEAHQIVDAGVDVLVAQGIEAGGHRGVFDPQAFDEGLGTVALTRLLVQQLNVPVIASGGIMDGAGIVAALALGAQAAQLGTAFVPCPETSIDDGYRRAILGDSAHHTIMTSAISGRPARSLVNRFTEIGRQPELPKTPDYPIAYDAGKSLHASAKAKGEFGYGAQWGGQAAALARSMPAAQLMATLEEEMRETYQSLGRVLG